MNDIARALIYVVEENNPDLVVDIYHNVVAARNVSCVDITDAIADARRHLHAGRHLHRDAYDTLISLDSHPTRTGQYDY